MSLRRPYGAAPCCRGNEPESRQIRVRSSKQVGCACRATWSDGPAPKGGCVQSPLSPARILKTLNELGAAAAAHYSAGRYAEAVAAYRMALAIAPRNAGILHNLGVALAAAGQSDDAAASFRNASAAAPLAADSWLALGHLEFARNRLPAAKEAFSRAFALAPNSIDALFDLGYVNHELGDFAEAIPPLEVARKLDPGNEQIWWHLFSSRLSAGDRATALREFLEFEANCSFTPLLFLAALNCIRGMGDPQREARYLRRALDLEYVSKDRTALAAILLRLQYFDVSREELFRLYQSYDRLMQEPVAGITPLARSTRLPGKRVRIGYMSADFNWHVMGRLMLDVIAAHDRDRYAIYLYSLRNAGSDSMTASFRNLADRFVELPWPGDTEAARVIADDDCDVLVDLMGHSTYSRPAILALKPARVIVTHLGYHGAVGLSQVDFKITDRYADLPDAGQFQIEKPLAMASCILPFRRAPSESAIPPSREKLGIAANEIVLGEFVTIRKLSPRCLALWKTILAAAPLSVLLFSPSSPADQSAFVREIEGAGIDVARIRFIERGGDYVADRARYRIVDIVLDTLPYSGGDTTIAALENGVPVVTLAGTRHSERVSASILWHLDLDGLVASTEEDYVRKTVALASDGAHRVRVRTMVAARYTEISSTHPERYVRDLEAALDEAIASAPTLRG